MFYRLLKISFGLMILSMIGCETNKDFTLNIEKEYTINYQTTVTAQDSAVVPALTNSDFDKHKFDIQSAELQNAAYVVTSLQPPAGKKADSIKVDSIRIRVGDIFGNKYTNLITMKNIYLNSALTSQPLIVQGSDGKTVFENLISNSPYSARINLNYSNPKDSTLYKVKLSFAFKINYKQKTL